LYRYDAAEGAKSSMPKMVVQGYKELKLIYYFTAGEKEVRCWTVGEGRVGTFHVILQSKHQLMTDGVLGFWVLGLGLLNPKT
jgi:ribosome-binding ATPase YchF (GTP1/OBG family)